MPVINRSRLTPTSGQLLAVSVAILLLGFFARLHNLGGDSFWIDEILTVNAAQRGLGAILNIRDHPPLLYALTALAIRAWGDTEFAARIPAFLAGILALPLIILLGRLIRQPVAGLWAALLLALSPVHIGYSQEARHYALLVTISLATTIVLYQAFIKPRWSFWIAYALLTTINLYNHYGALLVLISQALLIIGWSFSRLRHAGISGAWHYWRYPAVSALLVFFIYLPWMPRLQTLANNNLGPDALTGTGGIASLGEWLRLLFYQFGMYRGWLPFLILALALFGLVFLVWRRLWTEFALIVSVVLIPLLLIQLFQASRGVYARYVLYMLPFYLLAAAIGLNGVIENATWPRFGQCGYMSISILLAGLIMAVSWPGLAAEYEQIQEDWQGILRYLDETSTGGDVLVGATMQYRNQFNLVADSLPHYLNADDNDYLWLPAGKFGLDTASELASHQSAASVVAFDWNEPAALMNTKLEVDSFQTALFVGRQPLLSGNSLDNAIALFRQLLSVTIDPLQACLFKEDLAVLLTADAQPASALARLDEIQEECPDLDDRPRYIDTRVEAMKNQLDVLLADGRYPAAESLATRLLQYRPENTTALDTLTEYNLLDLWVEGQAEVDERNSPEPVGLAEFTMPMEGNAREVMLIHPPASVTYHLELPDTQTMLRSRVALAPRSWAWGGDGATFIVQIEPADGSSDTQYWTHVGNEDQDHVWHIVEIPLDEYAGQEVTITLNTNAGPVGDATGDWAGWAAPRILRTAPYS